ALATLACSHQVFAFTVFGDDERQLVDFEKNGKDLTAVGLVINDRDFNFRRGISMGFNDCTGTLISDNLVLTANHCVKDDKSLPCFFPSALAGERLYRDRDEEKYSCAVKVWRGYG